jgi:hypothetical protein
VVFFRFSLNIGKGMDYRESIASALRPQDILSLTCFFFLSPLVPCHALLVTLVLLSLLGFRPRK